MSLAAPIWAALISAGALLTVAYVTYRTQYALAFLRIRVDVEIKLIDTDLKHLETLLNSFINAANAANRYVLASPDIDISDWDARKKYVFPIVDDLGRARAELKAVGDFEGRALAVDALQSLEELTSADNEDRKSLKKAWKSDLIGDAIYAISRARLDRVETVNQNWQNKTKGGSKFKLGSASREEING
ncbi:hypothetical protein [Actinomadura madurae]|uniref:hypothetical protein n=1 Tax=Actinomadura madurae TaxID=1993 RepID=UPI001160A073|nr:hypothetical protein [Actinomadura madurae]